MNTAPPSVPPVAAPLHCEQCDCRNDLAFRFEFAFQPIVDVAARRIFAQEALVRGSSLRWTVLRPARFSHAPAGGPLHVGENLRWGWRGISREDVAALMVRLIDDTSAIGKVLTVA